MKFAPFPLTQYRQRVTQEGTGPGLRHTDCLSSKSYMHRTYGTNEVSETASKACLQSLAWGASQLSAVEAQLHCCARLSESQSRPWLQSLCLGKVPAPYSARGGAMGPKASWEQGRWRTTTPGQWGPDLTPSETQADAWAAWKPVTSASGSAGEAPLEATREIISAEVAVQTAPWLLFKLRKGLCPYTDRP